MQQDEGDYGDDFEKTIRNNKPRPISNMSENTDTRDVTSISRDLLNGLRESQK